MNNKYAKLHSILRMLGALLAIIVFVSMFITKMVVRKDNADLFYDFNSGAFFGDTKYGLCSGNVFGFIGYLLVLLGGLAGLAFVFIDEIIGKDLTKKLAFVAGGAAVAGALLILFFAPMFIGINSDNFGSNAKYYTTAAGPIVFGIFGLVVGAIGVAAPILENKGL